MFPDPTIAAVSLAMASILSDPHFAEETCVPDSGPLLGPVECMTDQDDAMPLIEIDLMEGHSPEVHRELVARRTALCAEVVVTPIERFRAAVKVIPADQWGLGGVPGAEPVSPLIKIFLMEVGLKVPASQNFGRSSLPLSAVTGSRLGEADADHTEVLHSCSDVVAGFHRNGFGNAARHHQ